jgi:membrane protein implicated in regulation of membrane protease activity
MKQTTKTRLVFFAILAVMLLILAVSLSMQVMDSGALQQLFIGATIFSVGVVLLDFLGIFGDSDSEGDSGDAHADLDGGMDFDGGHGEMDAGGDLDGGDLDSGDGGDHAGDATAGQLGSGHTVLSVLSYLRLFVYFCLGFGPTGWASLASGRSVGSSLLLATGVGVVAVFIAQAFFRFQRSSTDSSVGGDDLLAQRATVTIPLSHSDMGRVRVQLGMSVAEPYALAAREGESYAKGDTVRIVKVADDCVYVE